MRWYLIHTKPGSEVLAQSNLKRQGYGVYLPRLLQAVRQRGRWRDRIVPLFPRYLFLSLEEGMQPLAPVRSTVGVAQVVCFGTKYAIVPDQVVRNLQLRADSLSGLHRMESGSSFEPGMPVKMVDGPFDSLEGVFQRTAGTERVLVLLNLLGQNTSVHVPVDSVVPSLAR